MSFATLVAAMIEDALSRFRVPASRIVDQLSGTQVAPAQAGSPGVVDLDNVVSPSTLAAHTGNTNNPHSVTAEQVGAVPTGRTITINGTPQDLSEDRSWTVGGGMTNPMTTANDLIIGGTAGLPARLGKGAAGQILTVDPSTLNLVWRTPTLADIGAVGTSDSRLSDARTPTAHKTSHATGGTDALVPADIGAIATSALTSTNPAALGSAAAPGSSTNVARLDHVHPYPTAAQVGAAATSHSHAAGDITSGILAVARGGTGRSIYPAFRVGRNTPTAKINTNTITKLAYTTEQTDNNGEFDIANSRHVVVQAGTWIYNVTTTYGPCSPNGAGFIQILLYVNGSIRDVPPSPYPPAITNSYPGLRGTMIVPGLVAGDIVEVYVRQTMIASPGIALNGEAGLVSTVWEGIHYGS